MPKGMLRWRLKSRLAMMREHRGLSQAELARAVFVHKGTIARWETDESHPSNEMVEKLTKVLRCRARDLFPFE
jgi:DNA-binding XRE family transcriptional regulator